MPGLLRLFAPAAIVETGPQHISKPPIFVHHARVPGDPVETAWGLTMRKVSLFVAALLVAAFATAGDAAKNSSSAQTVEQRDSFIRDALFPAGAKPAVAAPAKKAAKKAKKAKKGKKAAPKKKA
jgi:hypothetical protein